MINPSISLHGPLRAEAMSAPLADGMTHYVVITHRDEYGYGDLTIHVSSRHAAAIVADAINYCFPKEAANV